MKNQKLKSFLLDTASIGGGCALLGVSMVVFTIPNNIAPGGVGGLATALAYITSISVGVWSLILNVPLLLLAWRKMGLLHLVKTIVATVLLSAVIDAFGLFLPGYTGNTLLAAVFGGALSGVGVGVLYLRGNNTGGTDLLTLLIAKKLPNIPLGSLLLCIDAAVVVIAVLIFRDIEVALYSAVTIFVASKLIDTIMQGVDYAKVVNIITDKGNEVAQVLNVETERGVTILPARGSYTGNEKTMLITVTRQNVLSQTLQLVKSVDPNAFIYVSNSTEVHGEGFKQDLK